VEAIETTWTDTPPLIAIRDGKLCVEVRAGNRIIYASIGDGRYFAEMVFKRLVAPRIAPRRTDIAPVDVSEV
jgi:hypothetical protein